MLLASFYLLFSCIFFLFICKKKLSGILGFSLFYSSTSKLISACFLDSGNYSSVESQLHYFAYSHSSSYFFFLSNLVMFLFFFIGLGRFSFSNFKDNFFKKKIKYLSQEAKVLVLLSFIILIYYIVLFYINNNFSFQATDRHEFFSNLMFNGFIFGILLIFIPFISGTLILKKYFFYSFLLLLIYFLYLFLIGQKLHGFIIPILVLFFFMIVYRLMYGLKIKYFLFLLLFSIILFIYSAFDLYERGIQNNTEFFNPLFYRIFILQGSAYHSIYSYVNLSSQPTFNFIEFFDSDLISSFVLGDKFDLYNDRNVNLSIGLQSYAYYILGNYGVLIFCIYGYAYGFIVRLLFTSIEHSRFYLIFLYSYIWLFFNSIYARGSLSVFLDLKLYFFIFLIIILSNLYTKKLKLS